jgi:hypothetical protein
MRTITASYIVTSEWKIPTKLNLLSEEENNKRENEGKVGSWWIKWNTLFYIDENGIEKELEKYRNAYDADGDEYKWADTITDEDDGDDEEEDT